jgi:hypothetical protein
MHFSVATLRKLCPYWSGLSHLAAPSLSPSQNSLPSIFHRIIDMLLTLFCEDINSLAVVFVWSQDMAGALISASTRLTAARNSIFSLWYTRRFSEASISASRTLEYLHPGHANSCGPTGMMTLDAEQTTTSKVNHEINWHRDFLIVHMIYLACSEY